ncbi:hypothetical protein [Haliangium ochraceum]|uniref:Uncharacterized protein n=1 Tax=Haliangium ochraceum (strain DSM 14365 / JCM 11303 / SMP-2) TaxID=502025 RepID=D0LI37_HALO1|nr:hypothetical protein [Haliangium ochraceum]ACY14866.1 hypothetical protein Hoch_2324 [Haliangium ochraceum DSM 14365]
MTQTPRSKSAESDAEIAAAAARLAERVSRREGQPADLSEDAPTIPSWWREGLAVHAIFGDGLLSFPGRDAHSFSRPVAFLSASELAQVAGGEYVPLAWLDGGAFVALVQNQGTMPVIAVSVETLQGVSTGPQEAEPLTDSLVAFLDALMPQTVCRLVGPKGEVGIELIGERSLLVEEEGQIERRDFPSGDSVGEYMAGFLDRALEAGMNLGFASARLRQHILERIAKLKPKRHAVPPEQRARLAVLQLIADSHLELEEDADEDTLEDLIDAAARFLEKGSGERNLVRRFADWLAQQPAVVDLYADDDTVQAALVSLD